jgi:hypothetical protein
MSLGAQIYYYFRDISKQSEAPVGFNLAISATLYELNTTTFGRVNSLGSLILASSSVKGTYFF